MMLSDEYMVSRTNEHVFAGYERDAELQRRARERREDVRRDARGALRARRAARAQRLPVVEAAAEVGAGRRAAQDAVDADAEPARELVDACR